MPSALVGEFFTTEPPSKPDTNHVYTLFKYIYIYIYKTTFYIYIWKIVESYVFLQSANYSVTEVFIQHIR